MPIAEANGERLYYEVHGEGEPLLCVMGLGTDARAWIPLIRSWSAERKLIVFDNRDCGRSSYSDEPYEIADLAQDTLALADELDIESFDLVGMSMGGAVAQQVALTAPDRVRTLTLIVSYGGLGPYGEARARVFGNLVKGMNHEEQTDFLMMLTFSEGFFNDSERFRRLREILLADESPQPPEALDRQLHASGRHEVRERLPELTMPVHVIGAERDLMVPVWKSRELAELIPDAKLTILQGAPHAVNIERSEELSRLVLDFIGEHEASAAEPAPQN